MNTLKQLLATALVVIRGAGRARPPASEQNPQTLG